LLGGVVLEKTAEILHYFFDSPIQMNPQRSNNGFFTYKVEEVMKELANLKNILAAFHAKPVEVYCGLRWIESSIGGRHCELRTIWKKSSRANSLMN
jgi:hypothetical protein